MRRGGTPGRKFGTPRSEYPELNALVALMQEWIRDAGQTGTSVFTKLTPLNFGAGGVPKRSKFFLMLKGENLNWGFVEAVADVCSEQDHGAQAHMLGKAKPLWEAYLKARCELPAAARPVLAELQDKVIKLQDELLAEKGRLQEAQEKNALISDRMWRLSFHVQLLIRFMQSEMDRLARERDLQAANSPTGKPRSDVATRELNAVAVHEQEAVEELRRIHQDLQRARDLADRAQRRITFLRHRVAKMRDTPPEADVPGASADGPQLHLAPALQAAPETGSVNDFGEALADVRARLDTSEKELQALQEVIAGPEDATEHRPRETPDAEARGCEARGATVLRLSGTTPDNPVPADRIPAQARSLRSEPAADAPVRAPGNDGPANTGSPGLSATAPDNPAGGGRITGPGDEATEEDAEQREKYAAAARERRDLADQMWGDGLPMRASKVWTWMGTAAEAEDLAYSTNELLTAGRVSEAELAMNSTAKRAPEQLPEIVRALHRRCGHESGMWLLDIIGRIREPADIPDVLDTLRAHGMWSAAWRVVGAVAWYRYPHGIPPVLDALREMQMTQDIALVLNDIRQRTAEDQRHIRVDLQQRGEHRWAALLQSTLPPHA